MKTLFIILVFCLGCLGCVAESAQAIEPDIMSISASRPVVVREDDKAVYLQCGISNRYEINVSADRIVKIYGYLDLAETKEGVVLYVAPKDYEIKGQEVYISLIKICK
jgi:hypothetical protein